jgi:hypothetical protein
MPDRPFALSIVPPSPPPVEDDYDVICATLMESARGRWFLEEYARRNRNADTTAVLAAIERLEGVVRGEREQQPQQDFRALLLDMANAITATRAEVAALAPQPQGRAETNGAGASPDHPHAAAAGAHVLAAAERIADVAWTMRERGFDPKTCDQIEALATSILKAPSLHKADDQRAQQLSEVLVYLERRVNGMLAGMLPAWAGAAAAREPIEPEPEIGATAAEPPGIDGATDESAALALPADLPSPSRMRKSGKPDLRPESDEAASEATSADAAAIDHETAAADSPAPEAAAIELPPPEAAAADGLLGPMPLPVSLALPTAPVVLPPPSPVVPEGIAEPAQPVASPAPRLAARDPLAFLKAMSSEELIALFT